MFRRDRPTGRFPGHMRAGFAIGFDAAPATFVIVFVCLAVFLVQRIMARTPDFESMLLLGFGLSRSYLARGFVWQPVSYMFLHGSFLHLALNMLVVVFFGAGLEREIGTRRFSALFLLSGIAGGAGWLLLAGRADAVCIGASGGVFGLIGAYAGWFPRREVTLLLFFVIPVTLQAWVLALILGLSNLTDLLFGSQGNIAHAAHLAGGLAGFLYARIPRASSGATRMFRTGSLRRRSGVQERFGALFGTGPPGSDEGCEDLDGLLDKINRSGLGSLSRAERQALRRHARRGLYGHDGPDGGL